MSGMHDASPLDSCCRRVPALAGARLSRRRARGAGAQTVEEPRNPHQDLSLFTHSDNCVACHNNLATPSGEDVSIGATWRSTMMANSARDPYWQAGVRRETIDHPSHAADIQDECAACHMPMPQRIASAAGGKGEVFAHLPDRTGQIHPPRTGWPPTACRARSAIRSRPKRWARATASTATS